MKNEKDKIGMQTSSIEDCKSLEIYAVDHNANFLKKYNDAVTMEAKNKEPGFYSAMYYRVKSDIRKTQGLIDERMMYAALYSTVSKISEELQKNGVDPSEFFKKCMENYRITGNASMYALNDIYRLLETEISNGCNDYARLVEMGSFLCRSYYTRVLLDVSNTIVYMMSMYVVNNEKLFNHMIDFIDVQVTNIFGEIFEMYSSCVLPNALLSIYPILSDDNLKFVKGIEYGKPNEEKSIDKYFPPYTPY